MSIGRGTDFRPAPRAQPSMTTALTCRQCRHFVAEPEGLEALIPGLNIVSSAYGSVRADTAYCGFKDIFLLPAAACPGFEPCQDRDPR